MEGTNQGKQVYYAYSTPNTEVFIPKAEGMLKTLLPSGELAGLVHVERFQVPENRATIAITVEGNCFKYGISICSNTDNFNKQKGREMALERLEAGFGQKCFTGNIYEAMMGNEESKRRATITFMMRLVNSIEGKMNKYKRRISEFEKARRTPGVPAALPESKPEVVDLDVAQQNTGNTRVPNPAITVVHV